MLGDSRTKPMEILLVEDGLVDARITIHALRRSGVHHRLTLVRTVHEAILFMKRTGIFARAPRLDLLLLDMILPDGTGLDVLEEMLEIHPDSARITTVVLTALEDDTYRQRCDELGVYDYIQKPVSEEEFLRVVRDHKKLMIHLQQVAVATADQEAQGSSVSSS
ncbi:response regulator [Rhodopirellula sallentina]|uniref:Response regulator receiver protein n=1 Tax=Rhodopirellula sallentina SM41 TaxID=1263870 RepID=M5UBS4_9BACT|nr:response regulator [Rhodopirellula sallentina]EMI55301.1 response regulator receiver protein [Rhodopirellula sallentina SM41]